MFNPLRHCMRASAVALALVAAPASAIQTCELDGQPINPNNGSTTAGKSGLMRCKDADTGVVTREQELRDGRFMGVERFFKAGQVERENHVNERGNRDGLSREWDVGADGRRVLVREETAKNGSTIGVARSWYPSGTLRRLTFYGDEGREQAYVEFTEAGKLYGLRCASRPVFAADYDDKAACGYGAAPSTVTLFGGKGQPTSRITFDHGERRRTETLWDSGAIHEVRETTPTGGVERTFAADGTKRHEVQWVAVASPMPDARPRNVNVLDQEFHESGKLVRERRWVPSERGADPVSETTWYLNGQISTKVEYVGTADRQVRRDASYYDNGKLESEGNWVVSNARGNRFELPAGTHKTFDSQGRLRGETIYDDRGRLTRERAFDETGGVVRDDEVFEDGSRKAAGR